MLKLFLFCCFVGALAITGCTRNHSGHEHDHSALAEVEAHGMKDLSDDIEATRGAIKETVAALKSGDLDPEKLAQLEQLLGQTEARVEKIAARLNDIEDGDHGHGAEHEGHDHDGEGHGAEHEGHDHDG